MLSISHKTPKFSDMDYKVMSACTYSFDLYGLDGITCEFSLRGQNKLLTCCAQVFVTVRPALVTLMMRNVQMAS